MKAIVIWFCLISFQCSAQVIVQGTFWNLDFERGRIVPVNPPTWSVDAAKALRTWQAYTYGLKSTILYNSFSLGAPEVSIQDNFNVGGIPILEGKYSLYLQSEFPSGTPIPYITQTAILPYWGKSVCFLTAKENEPTFSVYLDSVQLDLVPLHQRLYNGYVWGANFDISNYGEREVELRIAGSGALDYVFFSGVEVPEPGVCSLTAMGALCGAWCLRHRRAKRPKSLNRSIT